MNIDLVKLDALKVIVAFAHGKYREGDDDGYLAKNLDVGIYEMPSYWAALERDGFAVWRHGYLWGVDPFGRTK